MTRGEAAFQVVLAVSEANDPILAVMTIRAISEVARAELTPPEPGHHPTFTVTPFSARYRKTTAPA